MRGRTVILISHRVSTVRQAGGYYADLCRKEMLEEELEAI
jgi:ABC-type multidrug transport system fused ATPase/permease subunit